jgi:mercuric ion transport protein
MQEIGLMPTVELIYDTDCPNVGAAREQLRSALDTTGLPIHWQEWDREAADSPGHARLFGSPSILVDGKDVAGVPPSAAASCCRVYPNHNGGMKGVPSVECIVAALHRSEEVTTEMATDSKRGIHQTLAVAPAVGSALLPALACPACWPAYLGLLSTLGLGFVDYTPYLLPMTIGFLILALIALGYRARHRRGYRPLLLGTVGSIILVVGKFVSYSNMATYFGIACLLAASLWNSRALQSEEPEACPTCK